MWHNEIIRIFETSYMIITNLKSIEKSVNLKYARV